MVTVDLANNLMSIILSALLVIGIFISFVAWFIRLESKVQYLEKDHVDHKEEVEKNNASYKIESHARDKAIWEKFEAIQKGMNQILQTLGNIEGRLDSRVDHR